LEKKNTVFLLFSVFNLKKTKNEIENPLATSFRELNSLFKNKIKKFKKVNPMAKSDVF
jgi:hypothetical protein